MYLNCSLYTSENVPLFCRSQVQCVQSSNDQLILRRGLSCPDRMVFMVFHAPVFAESAIVTLLLSLYLQRLIDQKLRGFTKVGCRCF